MMSNPNIQPNKNNNLKIVGNIIESKDAEPNDGILVKLTKEEFKLIQRKRDKKKLEYFTE